MIKIYHIQDNARNWLDARIIIAENDEQALEIAKTDGTKMPHIEKSSEILVGVFDYFIE